MNKHWCRGGANRYRTRFPRTGCLLAEMELDLECGSALSADVESSVPEADIDGQQVLKALPELLLEDVQPETEVCGLQQCLCGAQYARKGLQTYR